MFRILSITKIFTLAVFVTSCSVLAAGPKISVIEMNSEGTPIHTFEFKADLPQKRLTRTEDGRTVLNTDEKSPQELGVKTLLSANFHFDYVCNYREYAEFAKNHPDKPRWKVSQLFTKYILENKITLKKNGQCFAEELETLTKAHPCLSEKATIQFYVMPVPNAREWDDHGNDDWRRVVGVGILGCPYGGGDRILPPCSFMRDPNEDGNFFGPPKWAKLVRECAAEFKKPEIKKMADAAMKTSQIPN